MGSITQALKKFWDRPRGEKIFASIMIALGFLFIARGAYLFRVLHFGVLDFLGCLIGAFGGFFLLIVSAYVFHHARLVFIPWFIMLIYIGIIQPHFAVGMGLAFWAMVASEMGR
jgi:hypothetical protein